MRACNFAREKRCEPAILHGKSAVSLQKPQGKKRCIPAKSAQKTPCSRHFTQRFQNKGDRAFIIISRRKRFIQLFRKKRLGSEFSLIHGSSMERESPQA